MFLKPILIFLYYLHRAFFNNSQITHQRNAPYFHFLFFNPYICFSLYKVIFRGLVVYIYIHCLCLQNLNGRIPPLKSVSGGLSEFKKWTGFLDFTFVSQTLDKTRPSDRKHNTGHTQKNGAVSKEFTIDTAPFFCVCPVYYLVLFAGSIIPG
jgi:hypothetical protein